jgi:hypothetical protein
MSGVRQNTTLPHVPRGAVHGIEGTRARVHGDDQLAMRGVVMDDVKRLWKLPFLVLGLGELFLVLLRTRQVCGKATSAPDPSTGRTFLYSDSNVTCYLTAAQHRGLVYLYVGIAAFFICYLISSFVTAGGRGFFRLLPIDGPDVDPFNRRWAFTLTSFGALVGIAAITYSFWQGS